MSLDAFGRLRVSNCFTVFNYYPTPLTENNNLDIDTWVNITNGSGSSSYNSNNYIEMSVENSGDYVLRMTKQPMEYQSGKSRLVYLTGVMLGESVGSDTLTSRLGLFNVDTTTPTYTTITDGIYFQTDGTNLQWVETIQTGTTIVNQASWNIDVFDGDGPSGKTLTSSNLTKTMLFVIDQEWLGVGRVRCGFIIDGVIYYAHEFNHGSLTVQYTKTPRQRIAQQIIGTSLSSTHTTRQMCSTCIIEGGYYPLYRRIGISNLTTSVSLSNAGTKYILLGLKLNSSYKNGTINPLNVSVVYFAGGGNGGLFELQLHSTNGSIGSISGSLSYSQISNSLSQYAVGDGTQTISSDGFIFANGYIIGKSTQTIARTLEEILLNRTICTIYDTIYLVGSGDSNNDEMYGSIDFIESN